MRLRTSQISLVLLLSVLVPICFVVSVAKSQAPEKSCKGHHPDKWDIYSEVRMLPPLKVSDINDNRLEWEFIERGIHLGSLELEPGYTMVPNGFDSQHHDGCYGITYCQKHLVVLRIDSLPPAACK